ncbi:hypothetical protein [uncultured Sulfitobacter sp.]|uniref:hypothetical protein n=1 Tax=uncultured Sulfitobacter sp. TaxID=191468 RepID=UPI002628DA6C|nr:hypothetical protein [uncultured Sulfitobacter sp.]
MSGPHLSRIGLCGRRVMTTKCLCNQTEYAAHPGLVIVDDKESEAYEGITFSSIVAKTDPIYESIADCP